MFSNNEKSLSINDEKAYPKDTQKMRMKVSEFRAYLSQYKDEESIKFASKLNKALISLKLMDNTELTADHFYQLMTDTQLFYNPQDIRSLYTPILVEDFRKLIANMINPEKQENIIYLLFGLYDEKILTKRNFFDLLKAQKSAHQLGCLFSSLNKAGILEDNRQSLMTIALDTNKNMHLLMHACIYLNENKSLTTEFFKILVANLNDAYDIAMSLHSLKSGGVLIKKYVDLILKYPKKALSIAMGLASLNKDNILTKENEDTIFTSDFLDPSGLANTLCELYKAKILNDKTRKACVKNAKLFFPYYLFSQLNSHGLLNEVNFFKIINNIQYDHEIHKWNRKLIEADLFNESNFEKICMYISIVGNKAVQESLEKLYEEQRCYPQFKHLVIKLTQKDFDFIIKLIKSESQADTSIDLVSTYLECLTQKREKLITPLSKVSMFSDNKKIAREKSSSNDAPEMKR